MDFKNDNIMSDENILGGSMLVKRSKRNSFFQNLFCTPLFTINHKEISIYYALFCK